MKFPRLLLACLFAGVLLVSLALNAFEVRSSNRVVAESLDSAAIAEEYINTFKNMSFSTMPPVTSSGSVEVPELGTIAWEVGQTIGEFLPLGSFYDSFNLQLLSMENIAQLAGINLDDLSIGDIGLSDWQNLSSLVAAIPDLGNLQVMSSPLVQDLASQVLGSDIQPWEELSIDQLIQTYNLGDLSLGSIDLSQYGLDSIPGFSQAALGRFDNWEQTLISQIPGLSNVPFASLSSIPTGVGFIALHDVTYGEKEARRVNTITGSDKEGFKVPCNKDSCPYIELSGTDNLLAMALHGKQWIVGPAQMVKGGHGLLGVVNGGKEPTGRHPYGKSFKVVLEKTVESKGLGDFALYFRYCKGIYGCTPYFIGPVPWFPSHEGDILFVGFDTFYADPPPDVPARPGLPPGTELPPEISPDPNNPPIDDDCLAKLLEAVPDSMRSYASQSIPLVLAEAKRLGVNDLRHIAYILATMQRESSFGADMVNENPGVNINGGNQYIPRGYAQITHDYNYIYWSKRLGIDLVNNPERATEPEIAAKIIVGGMRDGTFTGVDIEGNLVPGGGHKLSDYFNSSKTDFYNARKIINSLDRASDVATDVEKYWEILKKCSLSAAPTPGSLTECQAGNKFIWPAQGTFTSGYGPRNGRFHAGIDLAAPIGTQIIAANCGTVTLADTVSNDAAGKNITITHPNGSRTRYLHLNKLHVTQGMKVKSGQLIGDMGTTGRSTGPHLHFEVYPVAGGSAANPLTGSASN